MSRLLKIGGFVVFISFIVFVIYYSKGNAVDTECYEAIKAQNEAYKVDMLVNVENFDKYKVPVYSGKLADLNLKTSSQEAKSFRTWISAKIDEAGINFAGHYSIVYVGMTGWGDNYFLVDRNDGKAIPVPFLIGYVKTQPDSSLLIINPKDLVYSDTSYNREFSCEGSVTGTYQQSDSDLRPYYYNWDGTKFVQLGNEAKVNAFWKENF